MNKKKKIEDALKINSEQIKEKITNFIEEKIKEAGANGAVIGISGGLDSSTITYLCVEALGKDNVLAVFMPEKKVTSSRNAQDTTKIKENLDIKMKTVEISPILEKMKEKIGETEEEKIALANLKARIRMTILYYYANIYGYLVVGTSNKSETKCGYFTKYGDGASDISPIGSIYKTQVKKIAEKIGVPINIIEKPPTAGLWKGQTDEKELGLPYEKIDRVYAGLELGFKEEEIAKAVNVEKSEVKKFKKKEKNSKHKLQRPPVPDL